MINFIIYRMKIEGDSMYCSNCGKKLSSDDFFCSNCGTPVSRQGLFDDTSDVGENKIKFDLDETRLFDPESLEKAEKETNSVKIPIIYFPESDVSFHDTPIDNDEYIHDENVNQIVAFEENVEGGKDKNVFSALTGLWGAASNKIKKKKGVLYNQDNISYEHEEIASNFISEEQKDQYESVSIKKIMVPVIILGVIIGLVIGLIVTKPWNSNDEPSPTMQGNIYISQLIE